MTETQLRQKIVDKAKSYMGAVEGGTQHKEILGIYNGHKPLARGYAMKVTDAWCACFASAMAIACNFTDIIPTEVGCGEYIKLFQKIGRWQESDAYVPKAGDYIFYDWDDSGKGDNVGGADHVGIVEKVENGVITVIEGNKNDRVERRAIAVNGRFIRGFGIPNYASKATKEPAVTVKVETKVTMNNIELKTLKKGDKGAQVKTVQRILRELDYVGSDGKLLEVDGDFGSGTEAAVKRFQAKRGSKTCDGIVGEWTWTKLLKGW